MGADEVRELNDQLGDKERRMHDLSSQVKRLESEKQELQAAIEEADSALEQGDTKLQQALADQTELRAETERRVAEKDSEFETTRYTRTLCCINPATCTSCFYRRRSSVNFGGKTFLPEINSVRN